MCRRAYTYADGFKPRRRDQQPPAAAYFSFSKKGASRKWHDRRSNRRASGPHFPDIPHRHHQQQQQQQQQDQQQHQQQQDQRPPQDPDAQFNPEAPSRGGEGGTDTAPTAGREDAQPRDAVLVGEAWSENAVGGAEGSLGRERDRASVGDTGSQRPCEKGSRHVRQITPPLGAIPCRSSRVYAVGMEQNGTPNMREEVVYLSHVVLSYKSQGKKKPCSLGIQCRLEMLNGRCCGMHDHGEHRTHPPHPTPRPPSENNEAAESRRDSSSELHEFLYREGRSREDRRRAKVGAEDTSKRSTKPPLSLAADVLHQWNISEVPTTNIEKVPSRLRFDCR